MSRLAPLPPDTSPEMQQAFERYRRSLGFIPNSALILQRKPKTVQALAALSSTIWDPEGEGGKWFKCARPRQDCKTPLLIQDDIHKEETKGG